MNILQPTLHGSSTNKRRDEQEDDVVCIKAASEDSSQTTSSNVPAEPSSKWYKAGKAKLISVQS